jgi:uncharacterized protein YndB with AHSA1/START domain
MQNFVADGIFVDAAPERVFAALLQPEDIRAWMDATEAAVEPRVGGRFFARRADGSSVQGTIASMKAGSELRVAAYFWEKDGLRHGPMALGAQLSPRHGGTWITLRQDGLDSGPDWQRFAQAARKELVRATVAMKRHIEGI